MSQINTHLLPAALRELVSVLGEAAAFRLVERRGGGRLIVPKKVHPEHRLMDELGLKGFADLVAAYGSMVLELPKYDSVMRQLRHERVRKLRSDGMTVDRVAVATGYTRRQVFNILAADLDLPAGAQLDMFGGPDMFAADPAERREPAAFGANDPFGLTRKPA